MENRYPELLNDSEYKEIQDLRKNAMSFYFNEFLKQVANFKESYQNKESGMYEHYCQYITKSLEEFNAWSIGDLPHCVEFIRNKDSHLITYETIRDYDEV